MTPLTRRQLLTGGLGASALALAGCATPGTSSVNDEPTIPAAGEGEQITITYWAWLMNLQQVADIYNEQNPNVHVEISWIPGGNDGGYQTLYSALAADSGPDLAQVEVRSIPEFMMVNGLVDLSRYGVDEYEDRFDPTMWGQVNYSGSIYGIPQDSGPTAMYYRPDLFEEVGAEPPETWEEWAEVAAEIRSATGAYMDTFPIADASLFAAHAMQAGATWFRSDEDGWIINMADEATLDVARFFDKAIDDGVVATEGHFSPWWFAAASNDQIASMGQASWGDALLGGVSGAEGLWRVAPMPRWPNGYGSSQIGGSTSAVLANSRHPKEAMDFAVWLNSSSEGINALIESSGIGWSTNPDHIGDMREEPSEFFGGQEYNTEVFEPAAEDQNPDWEWWPITQRTFNILSDYFRDKATGTPLVDALVDAEEQIIDVFEAQGLTVRRENG